MTNVAWSLRGAKEIVGGLESTVIITTFSLSEQDIPRGVFIEARFSLPSLGYADVAADDFSDCFNFNQTPLQFHTNTAPFNAQYFLDDKTPPTDPDDD
jgi:hypothetical protein